ncbi:MAG: M28 family peptidase [Phycisphaerales bacterium]|nr:MAG: M28 family peptidase [Phycisphaerales bacterium]
MIIKRAGKWGMASLLAAAVLWLSVPAVASDEGLAAADEVSQAIYYDLMDNWLYTHAGDNRGFGAEHDLARDNIAFLMEGYGLTVTLEPFLYYGTTYYNVVGTKVGTLHPDQEVVIGGHYDSVDNPGADDNASGTALVLEAARIICQYDSDYTIRFVAFDREEQGLIGSYAYVSDHSSDDIIAMVGADMVAYDNGSNNALLYAHDAPLKAELGAAIVEYSNGLGYIDGGWNGQSDHRPFDEAGIPACLLIESQVWNNPYYHTQQDNMDNPDNINWEFAEKMTRSAVGWLVDKAVVHVPVNTLDFTFPDGLPEFIAPDGGTRLRVEVVGVGDETPEPGTGLLHYNTGGEWQSIPMDEITDNIYDAVFPAVDCTEEILYYVSAEAVGGTVYTYPRNAPDAHYSAIAAYGEVVMLEDNFETDTGWTVENYNLDTGAWERAIPAGSGGDRGDPPNDYDGSGKCYVTGNGYDEDIDGGPTRLISPTFDLTDSPDAYVSYARWFYNDDNDIDSLLCEVSNNNGSSWVTMENIVSGTGWQVASLRVSDFVTPNDQIRFRFSATDNPNDSVTEAGLDAFRITFYDCQSPCPADVNNSDVVDIDDLFQVLGAWGTCDDCPEDINDDGLVDIDDIFEVLGNWGPCP